MSKKYKSPIDRLIANTILSTESFYQGTPCWDWIGKRTLARGGRWYGRINTRYTKGAKKGKIKTWFVHRWVIVKISGRKLSPRQRGMHLCNNTLCANPEHLLGGTQRANIKQAIKEGRFHGNKPYKHTCQRCTDDPSLRWRYPSLHP